MSPLIYIGLLIMLITIVSEFVFIINYLYVRVVKKHPAKIQKKLFITFGIMLCGFIIFFLGTQKVFSSKEVASFEITDQNINNQNIIEVEQPDEQNNIIEPETTETVWYDQILTQENKERFNQILNDTGEAVDDVITIISDNVSQLFN